MPATNWFRRNQKKLMGVLVVFLMVIWGIGPAIDYLVPKPPVGEILGDNVSQEEFEDTVVRWARIFFRGPNESVPEQVWMQMALVRQAEKMGISVPIEELVQEIQRWFPVNPVALNNKEEYRRMLGAAFHMTEFQFEKTISEYLMAKKLEVLLGNSTKITKNEILQRYLKENELAKVKYATLNAKDFASDIEITEDEILAFYNKYSEDFPDSNAGGRGYKEHEKVKLEYIIARYKDIGKNNIVLTDNEMLEYYTKKKDLMFKKDDEYIAKTDENAGDEKVEDTSTTEYKTFEEVKEQIMVILARKKSEVTVDDLIDKLDNGINESIDNEKPIDFPGLAKKYGLSYVAPTNQKDGSNDFTKEDLNTVVLGTNNFSKLVFEREINDPSLPLGSLEGKLIFRVIEKKPSQTPPFEEIRDRVANDLREQKSFEKMIAFAEKSLEGIKQTSFDDGVKDIEKEVGEIEIVETDYFSRPGILGLNDYVKILGAYLPDLAELAFNLKTGETSVAVDGKKEKMCYIVTSVDRKKADLEKFEAEKKLIKNNYLMEKRYAFLAEWESWIKNQTHLGR